MGEEALVIDQELDEQPEDQPEAEEPEADKGTDEKPDEESGKEDDEKEARVEFTPEQQAKVDEIARRAAARNLEKLQEEREARQQLEAEVQKLRPQQQAQPGRPEVPPMPDPFADDFDAKMQQRDEALQRATQWDAVQYLTKQHQDAQRKAKEEAEQAELEKTVTAYQNRARKLGIKDAELQVSGRQVAAVGMAPELVQHVLHDAQGPALTVYLANHIEELDKIGGMSPIGAAIYIETQIKPKLTKRVSNPPPAPLESVRGSGQREGKLGGKGLVIE